MPETMDQQVRTAAARRLPIVLSVVAGMVDLTGFLTLGHIFTAHVTGNLAFLAADLVRGEAPRVAQALIVPLYMLAMTASFLIARRARLRDASPLSVLLWIQLLLLACVFVFSCITVPSARPEGVAADVAAAIAVCAMGCQYALVRMLLPGTPSTASMTINLTDTVLLLLDTAASNRSQTANARDRSMQAAGVLTGFLAGCVIAALAVSFLEDGAWSLPVGLAALALAIHRH